MGRHFRWIVFVEKTMTHIFIKKYCHRIVLTVQGKCTKCPPVSAVFCHPLKRMTKNSGDGCLPDRQVIYVRLPCLIKMIHLSHIFIKKHFRYFLKYTAHIFFVKYRRLILKNKYCIFL